MESNEIYLSSLYNYFLKRLLHKNTPKKEDDNEPKALEKYAAINTGTGYIAAINAKGHILHCCKRKQIRNAPERLREKRQRNYCACQKIRKNACNHPYPLR